MVKTIKIKCQNGISLKEAVRDIFFELDQHFTFVESEEPDFILFGPYGNEIPKPGNYIRIGYFSENIQPDMSICEYAFGIPTAAEINHPNYRRIQWHGLHPDLLVKKLSENDIDQLIETKDKFCNFIYSNPVAYREEFFRQLSKYKKVDAPGKSMNNMPSIDSIYEGSFWERKRKFLSPYKFTIAFENYAYPGYQTEKLYDSMQINSIPIYCGDIHINEIFNTKSFINVTDYLKFNDNSLIRFLELRSQQNFTDYRPAFFNGPQHRLNRKLKHIGRQLKMKLQFNDLDFSQVIERIIEIDQNDDLYAQYLREPWFLANKAPDNASLKEQWINIFNSKKA